LFCNCPNPLINAVLDPKIASFETNGGGSIESQIVYRFYSIKRPADPVRSGYTFDAWYIDNDAFQEEWDFDTTPTTDITLYANWIPITVDDPAHTHAWGDWEVIVPATCTTEGLRKRTCSAYPTHDESEIIGALGHDWGDWTQTKAPTETEDGEETRTCTHDNEHKETRPIGALDHTHVWGEWIQTTAPTCTTAGEDKRICTLNNAHYETRAVAIDLTAHNYGSWSVTTPPTCTTTGVETRTCSHNQTHTDTRTVAALGHAYGDWIQTKAPTETEDGEETRTCAHDPSHTETRPIGALDHTHVWGEWAQTTAPTCTTAGEDTRICTVNNAHYETRAIPALGHDWGEWIQKNAPTASKTGNETRTCKHDANHTEERTIPATGIKVDPVVTWPSAASIIYGAALSTSALTGGTGEGTFAWTNGSTIPTVANSGYNVTFTPTDTADYNTLTHDVAITVAKAAGATVGTPTLKSVSPDTASITINAVSAPASQAVEYAVSTTAFAPESGWQESTVFTGLTAGAVYYVYARSAASDNYKAGDASKSEPIAFNTNVITITVEAIAGSGISLSTSGPIVIFRTSGTQTATLTIENFNEYTNVVWRYNNEVLDAGQSLTLNAANSKYNMIGKKFLTVELWKNGVPYSETIEFEVRN